GKGNDQVRLEVSVGALAPELQVIAPIRQWGMSREQEMAYAQERGLPLQPKQGRFSIDENLWGRSIEAGELEDPWQETPEEAFAWTRPVQEAPDTPTYLELDFQQGLPTAVDGEEMPATDLVRHLNQVAGQHGVGRIDHVEDRLVGIKSREVYEAPAAVVLHAAHRALEALTLGREQLRWKAQVAQEYADLVYNGLWFTRHRRDLDAYVASTQRHVAGTVRVRLLKGTCTVVGRRSPRSLYQHGLATYDRGDQFDHRASEGFISIYGLPVRTQSQVQPEEGE
ncbi:MAG: argininosuccinate synthase, partial [Dehalococcoidia bacterium]